jgi:hypothetical protein
MMIDFRKFEYERALVETFVLAVLPRINEITALTIPGASEKLPSVGKA